MIKQQNISGLIQTFEHPKAEIRREVAKSVSTIHDKRIIQALMTSLLGDDDFIVRWNCAMSLGNIGDSQAVEVLSAALLDNMWVIRMSAAKSLMQINDPNSIQPLINSINDSSKDVKKFVIMALGGIGNVAALEPLIEQLGYEHWEVREATARSLGSLNDDRVIEPLLETLDDDNKQVRQEAAKALSNFTDIRVVEPLLKYGFAKESRKVKFKLLSQAINETEEIKILLDKLKGREKKEEITENDLDLLTISELQLEKIQEIAEALKDTSVADTVNQLFDKITNLRPSIQTIIQDSVVNKSNIGELNRGVFDKLEKLIEYHNQGMITDNEYINLKRNLLNDK